MKKCRVVLTDEERAALRRVTRRGSRGQTSARKVRRAHILLLADSGASDEEVVAALGVVPATVTRTCRRFAQGGLDAIEDQPRSGSAWLRGDKITRLVAEARRAPPGGRERWTLRLLAHRVVELGLADSCSHETVRRVLKNSGVNLY
jgi:transposase